MKPTETVFFNNRLMEKGKVCISPDDRGFLFADGVYEVIRCYNGKLFELEAHFKRLKRSLNELGIQYAAFDGLEHACQSLIKENNLDQKDATLYIQITRGAAKRKHYFPDPPVPATVYASASEFKDDPAKRKKGVTVLLAPDIRWNRCDIKTVSLLPNVLACQDAVSRDASETILIRDGAVTEGTHTNFAAVFDNELWTHPESNNILSGITRRVTLGLCKTIGIPAREYPVLANRLDRADEMMILGTTTEVMPVVNCNGRTVGNGLPGAVTLQLQQAFSKLTGR